MKKAEKSSFQKTVERTAFISAVLTLLFFLLHRCFQFEIFEILAITALNFAYHFIMRLIVGGIVPAVVSDAPLSPNSWWFRQKGFEKKLYKLLKVKNWKDKMPTYNPESYSLEKHTLAEIIRGTCVSELVHEVIIPLSFVPILFSIVWGTFAVFFITSLISALIDCTFVIMQRYNRPRMQSLLKRQERNLRKNKI